jgi:hypothetical protein
MNKIQNPFLKQIISQIADKTNDGRISDLSWGSLTEAKKKKKPLLRKEVAKKPVPAPEQEEPKDDAAPQGEESDDAGSGLPDLGGGEETGGESGGLPDLKGGKDQTSDDTSAENPQGDEGGDSEEDVNQAQADAVAKKAELEKAKAEKAQAEKEIEENSYVRLISSAGVHFLLGKLLDHAFKTDSIDALAGEMVQKLKIQTPDDLQAFSEEVAPFKTIPGIGELLTSMKTMASKTPETPTEDSSD